MVYLKAGFLALLAALALGAATGVWRAMALAYDRLPPGDRAVVLAAAISEALNCAAFLCILLIPIGLLAAFLLKRRRARAASRAE